MSISGVAPLTVDPLARVRVYIVCGLDAGGVGVLSRKGRVVPLALGLEVNPSAWQDTDAIVVGIGGEGESSTAHLAEPYQTELLLTVYQMLKDAGRAGVERVVVEDTTRLQPHSGALASVSDTYISLVDGQLGNTVKSGPASNAVRALLLHYGGRS